MRCLSCHTDDIAASTAICPRCGVHLPSLLRDVLPAGTLLRCGAYRVEYALGRGGFGITYRAVHTGLQQAVAVKEFYPQEHVIRNGTNLQLTPSDAQSEVYRRGLQRFQREGRILTRLAHPNVPRVYDLFEERGTAYLVMELVSGRTLRRILDERRCAPLPREQLRPIIDQVVGALEAIHQAGVYHLDIKPENLLVTDAARVVLVDFGAARQGFSSRSTQAYTAEYAAPEVIAGTQVGPESDLFELRMVLYELLTGERPPSALTRMLNDDWEPRGLEEPWHSLVAQALSLPRDRRPASVRTWWDSARRGSSVPTVEAARPPTRAPVPLPTLAATAGAPQLAPAAGSSLALADEEPLRTPNAAGRRSRGLRRAVIACGAAAAVLLLVLGARATAGSTGRPVTPPAQAQATATPTASGDAVPEASSTPLASATAAAGETRPPASSTAAASERRPSAVQPGPNYANELTDWGISPQTSLQRNVGSKTPTTIPGAEVVTTTRLYQTLQSERPPILIDALATPHDRTIPGAVRFPEAGSFGSFTDATQSQVRLRLARLTSGDRGAALVFFCQGAQCWESYNAALRAVHEGYANVYWYRGGLSAWQAAGLRLGS